MKGKYFNNSIVSFILIISTILSPMAFIPNKTQAEGITTYIGTASKVISQLPLCQGKLTKALSKIFTKKFNTTKILDNASTAATSNSSGNTMSNDGSEPIAGLGELESFLNSDIASSDAVKVEQTPDAKAVQKQILANTTATKESTDESNTNDTCLKSIGRAVIKILLQKLTTDTVNWINSGYEGSPLFVQNPGAFFKDIEKEQLIKFTSEINDSVLYPFGKDFIKNAALSLNNKFENNARYTLNDVIRSTNPEYSATSFNDDFSKGGWAAWDSLTQNPANNPLGFSIMSSNELAKRTEDGIGLASGSLQQSGGYLGVEKCSDPQDVTKEENEKAILERAESNEGPYQYRTCDGEFKLVTPGKMVADAATTAVNYSNNNLLKAEDLNDAVAAVLDAMLNQFAGGLMSRNGFLGLTHSDDWNLASEGTPLIDTNNTEDYSARSDFNGYQSSFLSQNPNFNIRTDLNQALLDEQRIYIDKIKEENKELKSTIPITKENNPSGFFTGNYGIIPTIYQLDYCIPGPHPGWENDSRNILSSSLALVTPETESTIGSKSMEEITNAVSTLSGLAFAAAGAYIGASVGSAVPIVGTMIGAAVGAIVGAVIAYIVNWANDKSAYEKLKYYYAGIIGSYTGQKIKADSTNKQVETLTSIENVSKALNTVLDRYAEIIHKVFRPEVMPEVTPEANQKFGELRGYLHMFSNNEKTIVSMRGVIEKLNGIKISIDKLNEQLSNNTITDRNGKVVPLESITDSDGNIIMGQKDQYEENLKPWIASFARLTSSMVTGDDIAVVEKRIKEIVDEKDYIYSNLLKGPNGCEQELAADQIGTDGYRLSWRVYNTKRVEYPGEILYDYNHWNNTNKKTLYFPDPYKSGYDKNTMILQNQDTPVNDVGPGFLSWVNFSDNTFSCSTHIGIPPVAEYAPDGDGTPVCLDVNELYPTNDGDAVPVGIKHTPIQLNVAGENLPGIFEGMIGVY